MMTPLPELSSLERLTLLPGESSKRSMLGMESPSLTMIAGVDENDLVKGVEVARRSEVEERKMDRENILLPAKICNAVQFTLFLPWM